MDSTTKIRFEKVTSAHLSTVFIDFAQDRKTPAADTGSQIGYWIAYVADQAVAMLIALRVTHQRDSAAEKLNRFSKTGHTYALDAIIGNPKLFAKGDRPQLLLYFADYIREFFDSKADTFIIVVSPSDQKRAKHGYVKAGFEYVGDVMMKNSIAGSAKEHHLLIKKFEPKISIIQATLDDYSCIQNMARFYVYDLSRSCGSLSSDWAIPENGLYEGFDFKNYFEEPSRKAYLIKVYDEIAGFVLLNQATEDATNSWNMGEFFIIAKFQGVGIGIRAAKEIWNKHPARWEVAVIPHNKPALKFWEKAISEYTDGSFNKNIKEVRYDKNCPQRVIFEFDTQKSSNNNIAP